MYEQFYGFSEKPFSLLPDAHFLYLGKRHKRIVNLLEYSAITQSGFMVISGEVGAGKTTAIRYFLKQLGPEATVGIITNPSQSLGRLLGWVAMAFSLNGHAEDDVKIYEQFVAFLVEQYAKGKRTILIIDEAQNLTAGQLEDLRMLSNVNNEKDQLLQIILVGQPELLATLKQPGLRQFIQRVSVHCHLSPLDPRETAAYIKHRLSVAGGNPELFDDKACAAVHYFAGGVPRLINLLCDQSLMYAFAEDLADVTYKTVWEVAADRENSGLSAYRKTDIGENEAGLLANLAPILAEIRSTS